MSKKILVADDEPGIVQLLKDYFEIQGYEVASAFNGVEALEQSSRRPDLILLDVNMPGLDGMIRDHVSCPILSLSAKVEEQDRIRGLMLGGDDYILKPFSIDELGARVEAHLRREERRTKVQAVKMQGGLAIHYTERCVYYDGKALNLTKTEFNIVELLSMHVGQVFTRESAAMTGKGTAVL